MPNAEEVEMGFPPSTKICPSDQQRLSGGCSEQPYAYLKTKYSPGAESATEGGKGISMLNPEYACRLYKFFKAADQAGFGGKAINIHSAWRSNETQSRLFNAAIAKYGSADAARKYVAPPGNSMHNKGLAVDLGFQSQAADAWAHKNLESFALYQRMGHEPWHIEPKGGISGASPTSGTGGASPYGTSAPYGQVSPLGYGSGQNTTQGPCPYGYVFYNSQCYSLQNQQPLGGMQQPMQQQPMQQQPMGSQSPSLPASQGAFPTSNTAQNSSATPVGSTQSGTQSGSTNATPNNQGTLAGLSELLEQSTATGTTQTTSGTQTNSATSTASGTSTGYASFGTSSVATYWDGTMHWRDPSMPPLIVATDTLAYGQWVASQQTFGQPGTGLDGLTASSTRGLYAILDGLRAQFRQMYLLLRYMRTNSAQEINWDLPHPQMIVPEEQYGD